jgi:hypothetical protein
LHVVSSGTARAGDETAHEHGSRDRDAREHRFDGSPIVRRDLSAGPGSETGFVPSALRDPTNGALLVVAGAQLRNVGRLLLFRCGPDGSACTSTDLSAGNDRSAAGALTALHDGAAKKLLVVFNDNQNSSRPSLLRCEPNGTGCVHADISAGAPASTGTDLVATIDAANGKLLVVAAGTGNGFRPALFRCELDGTACLFVDLAAGQGRLSGSSPSPLFDAACGRLLVVTTNGASLYRPGLFMLDGW